MIYLQDYDESIVHTELGGDAGREYYWGDMLVPYLKNHDILRCPSDSKPVVYDPLSGFSRQWSYNYGINDIIAAECTQMQSMWFETSKKVKKENLLSLRRKYLLANSLQNGATEHNHLTSLLSNSIQNGTTEHNHRTSVLSMLRHFISCK